MCLFATERRENRVLGPVYVLAFVDENKPKSLLPLASNRRFAKQSDGKLFPVGEVAPPQVGFGFAEVVRKLPRQPQQGGHVRSYPLPILHQRLVRSCRSSIGSNNRCEEFHFGEKGFYCLRLHTGRPSFYI